MQCQCITSGVVCHRCPENSAGSIPSHNGLGSAKMAGGVKVSFGFGSATMRIISYAEESCSITNLCFRFSDVSKWEFFW